MTKSTSPREPSGKFSGNIVTRLTHQLSAKGVPTARAEAVAHLQKHGVLYEGTEILTPTGQHRQKIGAAGRAKERAARQSPDHTAKDYIYDSHSNRARLKQT
jgi:hypothetical protein